MSNNKSYKPKQDKYDKLNKSSMMLHMGNSVETTLTLDNETKREEQNQCRICLNNEDEIGGKELFSVCKCIGSVKYLHQHCFISWINRSLQQKTPYEQQKIISSGNECQLCKFLIPIKSQTLTECASHQLIKLRIKSRPYLFVIFTIIETLCLVVISFIISMMVKLSIGFDNQRIVNSLILVCSLVVLLCLAVGVGYNYVWDYFIYERVVVVGFGEGVKNCNGENKASRLTSNICNGPNNFAGLRNKVFLTPNIQSNTSQQQPQTHIHIQPAINSQWNQNAVHIISSVQQLPL